MRPEQTEGELQAAMRRFFELAPGDQYRAFELMRDFLAADNGALPPSAVSEQAAALAAMTEAARHLGLADGEALTSSAFNAAARELGLAWNVSRVQRLFGRWRTAVELFQGHRSRQSSSQQLVRLRGGGRKRPREAHLSAVRRWLQTEPSAFRQSDYDAFAEEHNAHLSDGQLPLPRPVSIKVGLGLPWQAVLAVARREVSIEDAVTEQLTTAKPGEGGELIGIQTVSTLLGINRGAAQRRTHNPRFPRPVLTFARNRRAWLREDVEAFAAGRPLPERDMDELRSRYLTSSEVADAVVLDPAVVTTVAREQRVPMPAPAGRAGHTLYWRRDEVEEWVAANSELIQRRKALRAGKERRRPPGRERFVTRGSLGHLFGLSGRRAQSLLAEPDFPRHVAEISGRKVWLRTDVERYLLGHEVPPRRAAELQNEILSLAEVAALVGRSPNSINSEKRRRAFGLPPPDGRVSNRVYWERTTVKKWLEVNRGRKLSASARPIGTAANRPSG